MENLEKNISETERVGYKKCQYKGCPFYFKPHHTKRDTQLYCGSKRRRTGCSFTNGREQTKQWMKDHPGYMQSRSYGYRKNSEYIKRLALKQKEWRMNNPERVREYQERRNDRRRLSTGRA